MAALPDENRVGNFAYGRYLSCVALAYTLVGLRALADHRTVLGAVVALTTTAQVVVLYAAERLDSAVFIAFDFPEVIFLTRDPDSLELGLATASATALLAVFALVHRPVIALALINLVALVSITLPLRTEQSPDPTLPKGGVLTERSVPWQARAALYHQISWTKIGWYDRSRPIPSDTCTVLVPWPSGTPVERTWPEHPPSWRANPGPTGTAAWTCR